VEPRWKNLFDNIDSNNIDSIKSLGSGNRVAKKESLLHQPKELIADFFEASLRFQEVVETLEVQLDKETVRRLKQGEREYGQGRYKVSSSREEIESVLSAYL